MPLTDAGFRGAWMRFLLSARCHSRDSVAKAAKSLELSAFGGLRGLIASAQQAMKAANHAPNAGTLGPLKLPLSFVIVIVAQCDKGPSDHY